MAYNFVKKLFSHPHPRITGIFVTLEAKRGIVKGKEK